MASKTQHSQKKFFKAIHVLENKKCRKVERRKSHLPYSDTAICIILVIFSSPLSILSSSSCVPFSFSSFSSFFFYLFLDIVVAAWERVNIFVSWQCQKDCFMCEMMIITVGLFFLKDLFIYFCNI